MAQANQAPVLTPYPPEPPLFHPLPQQNEPQRDWPGSRLRLAEGKRGRPATRHEDMRQAPTDPPEHTRQRRPMAGACTGRRVEALRTRVTDMDADLVENL
ncbi:hypothetical protein [Streptomyces sp. DW26H14]|uniref:hypothetical protein n=1 Tax=Streptomyces sp. DW26H14 TaxID=3435395 RepID=UPI00403E2E07